jgi:ubiquinone/menaquinone biosynthesis C-methylase UbiE
MSDVSNQTTSFDGAAEWNDYWSKKNQGGVVYAAIASFYRKVIIRPNLNRFLKKYFDSSAELLHAGCGGGQVDRDISHHFSINALDISVNALRLYGIHNKGKGRLIHASIFETGLDSESMEGVYNLGVMEHFSREDIDRILGEFHRVLKKNGKLVLFWPPEYGLSVLFFKGLRKTIKTLSGKDAKFHPDEISRIQSRKQVTELLRDNHFDVVEYSFGPRDVFTYAIVVAQKAV